MDINETVRRIVMAGVGAVSLTVEKSRDIYDSLIKKGEEATDRSGVSYDQVKDQLTGQIKDLCDKVKKDLENASFEDLLSRCDDLDDEQRAALIDRLNHPLKEEKPCGGDECAECPCEGAEKPEDTGNKEE